MAHAAAPPRPSPEEVRADGGIAHLWTTVGGPSIELQEIDYAELLREKQGLERAIDEILAAAMNGRRLELDDRGMQVLLDIVRDPAKLGTLMERLQRASAGGGADTAAAVFLNIVRELCEYVSKTDPDGLPTLFQQMGQGARKLSADTMLALLARRGYPYATTAGVNVVSATIDSMADEAVAGFVARSVIAERAASERLVHAFRALVPEIDRQRQLLAFAHDEVASSALGREGNFSELWQRVEGMLTSYSDASFVSDDYSRELSLAQTTPVDVEHTNDDPPERVAQWLSTVGDVALRGYDRDLLIDLLAIETDPPRWRDIAETVVSHTDDLVRVGYFDQAWQLVDAIIVQRTAAEDRNPHAAAALERLGRGAMMKHVAAHLGAADEAGFERFKQLCRAIGPSAVRPLAEALSAEQDARSRRRLRDILLGFGVQGRDAVQQLMHAPNWEVRRTAAYLLREFGGAEGLEELVPLLTDQEPLVRREAIQGLVFNGTQQAAEILIRALTNATGRARQTLVNALVAVRDERAAPLFCHLVRRLDRRALPQVYIAAVDALSASKADDTIAALGFALQQGTGGRRSATGDFGRRRRSRSGGSARPRHSTSSVTFRRAGRAAPGR